MFYIPNTEARRPSLRVRRPQGITTFGTGRRPYHAFGDAGIAIHSIPHALRSFICSPTVFSPLTLLQSQTQGGTRYTPNLTRFWASVTPPELIVAIERALGGLSVRAVRAVNGPNGELRCRIGTLDARRVPLKGWAIVEPFATADGSVRSLCIMQRDEVILSPLTYAYDTNIDDEAHRVILYRGGGCSRPSYSHKKWRRVSSAVGSEDLE